MDKAPTLEELYKAVEQFSRTGELRAGLRHLKEETRPDGSVVLRFSQPLPYPTRNPADTLVLRHPQGPIKP